jgi:hypothetical protein
MFFLCVFASRSDPLFILFDKVPHPHSLLSNRSLTIKLLSKHLRIKLQLFIHPLKITVDLVLQLPKFTFFVGAQVPPLVDLQLQVVDGFLRLEDQRLQALAAFAFVVVRVVVVRVLMGAVLVCWAGCFFVEGTYV